MDTLLHSIQQYVDGPLTESLMSLFGLSDPSQVRILLAAALGFLAIILLMLAISFLRSGRRRHPPLSIADTTRQLSRKGAVVDLIEGNAEGPSLRCVITKAGRKRLHCDIVEKLDTPPESGSRVTLIFPPLAVTGGKVNIFSATLGKVDNDRLILETPHDYGFLKRREHVRKRVMDQQFIRVRLWVSPMDSSYAFQDSQPDVGVNSYAQDDSGHEANTVINISNGGMALNIRNQNLPPSCVNDGPVVLNIFLFNFREKEFKPYWCAGEIRSMEGGENGYTRIGIAFTGSGSPREDGSVDWNAKDYPPELQ